MKNMIVYMFSLMIAFVSITKAIELDTVIIDPELTAELKDKGWELVFPNGTNQNFTTFPSNRSIQFSNGVYTPNTTENGYLGTEKKYHKYHLKAQLKHVDNNNSRNAGILYHCNDTLPSSHSGHHNTANSGMFPYSIEFQGRIGNMGQLLPIVANSLAKNHDKGLYYQIPAYNANAGIDFDTAKASSCYGSWFCTPCLAGGCPGNFVNKAGNTNLIWAGGPGRFHPRGTKPLHSQNNPSPYYIPDKWNEMEIMSYAPDSVIFKINGALVTKVYNLRTGGPDFESLIPLDSGQIMFQIEGSKVQWRDIFIQEWDEKGCPVHGKDLPKKCESEDTTKSSVVGNAQEEFTVLYQPEYIQVEANKPFQLAIYDLQGNKVYQGSAGENIVPLSHIKTGVYFLSLQFESQQELLKMIFKK